MKHHYIPVFYLKQWAGPDGRVTVHARGHGGVIRAFPKHPDGTGYVEDLYAVPDSIDPMRHQVEVGFFSPADSRAAEAMRHLIDHSAEPMSIDRRSAWARFMMSLSLRDPASVEKLKQLVDAYFSNPGSMQEQYYSGRSPTDPPTVEEWLAVNREQLEAAAILMLPRLVDNVGLGNIINRMSWGVLTLGDSAHRLLTSDRPLITTSTLNQDSSYIALPLNEKKVFVAYNDDRLYDRLRNSDPTALSASFNKTVVCSATKYVWGKSDCALAFVQRHFGSINFPTVLERIIAARSGRS